MTTLDLTSARADASAARARAEAATPGEWHSGPPDEDESAWIETTFDGGYPVCGLDFTHSADIAFIVAARADVPTLAAHVEALCDEVERLRAMLRLREDALALCMSGAVTHVTMTNKP